MATTQELAVLAVCAYEFRRLDKNKMRTPEGWERVANVVAMGGDPSNPPGTFENLTSGFEGIAYQKGGEVAMSWTIQRKKII